MRELPALAGALLWLQVRYLQGQNDRLKEKLSLAERSSAAASAQKVGAPFSAKTPHTIIFRGSRVWGFMFRVSGDK